MRKFNALCLTMLTAAAGWGMPQPIHCWNFDEAHYWHDQPAGGQPVAKEARDHAGKYPMEFWTTDAPDWVSGRNFGGARLSPGRYLRGKRLIFGRLPVGASTIDCWVKCAKGGATKVVGCPSELYADGKWHHLAAVCNEDFGGEVIFYVDGQEKKRQRLVPNNRDWGWTFDGVRWLNEEPDCEFVVDEIHIFDSALDPQDIRTLKDNFAPRIYPQDYLIAAKGPSKTGSVLHGYTFDPDGDKLWVSRWSEPKAGKVVYNGDGTFTYTPGAGFKGRDAFDVTVTDGKGGYSTAEVQVHDARAMPRMAVTRFTNCRKLEVGKNLPGEARQVAAIDVDRDGRLDVVLCGGGRSELRVLRNAGKGLKREVPAVDAATGKPIADITGIAVRGKDLAARLPDGTIHLLEPKGFKNGAAVFKDGNVLKTKAGEPFKCPHTSMAFADFDGDGRQELYVGDGGGVSVYEGLVADAQERVPPGRGGVPPPPAAPRRVLSASYCVAPYFGDLNGDGKLDFVHGINWGTVSYWLAGGGGSSFAKATEDKTLPLPGGSRSVATGFDIMKSARKGQLHVEETEGREPKSGKERLLRALDGTHGAFGDFNGDGTVDFVFGGFRGASVYIAYGVPLDAAKDNLAKIDAMFKGHDKDLGQWLSGNGGDAAAWGHAALPGGERLAKYRELFRAWIEWAVNLSTPRAKRAAFDALKAHMARHPYLRWGATRDTASRGRGADKGKKPEEQPMHHVPFIFVQDWVVLDRLLPDSAAHRAEVADAVGLSGLMRKVYLDHGVIVAENGRASEVQLQTIDDFFDYHPRRLWPDDFISLDQLFGDGREAGCYVFESNKNTFGCEAGHSACEAARDIVESAERVLGKGSAQGDYFTLVMAHEVCHSLDAYVRSRANADLNRRWHDMVIFALNNGDPEKGPVVSGADGWIDFEATKARFRERGLWDGQEDWNKAWQNYWKQCPWRHEGFMRGALDFFVNAIQETFATQANHHWAGSEARLVGAIDRFRRGYRANVNEVVFFLDVLSCGMNMVPMYRFDVKPERVNWLVDRALLERDDRGRITRITIGKRVYAFAYDRQDRIIAVPAAPF